MGKFKIKNGDVAEIDYTIYFTPMEHKESPEIEEKKCTWKDVFEKYNLDNLEYDTSREPIQTASTEIIYDGTLYFLVQATLEVLERISKLYSDKKVIITEIKNEDEYNVKTSKPFRMMKTKIIVKYDIE